MKNLTPELSTELLDRLQPYMPLIITKSDKTLESYDHDGESMIPTKLWSDICKFLDHHFNGAENLIHLLSTESRYKLKGLYPVSITKYKSGYKFSGDRIEVFFDDLGHSGKVRYNKHFDAIISNINWNEIYNELSSMFTGVPKPDKVEEFAKEMIAESPKEIITLDQRISELRKLQFFINQLGYCSSKIDYTDAMKILYFVQETLNEK